MWVGPEDEYKNSKFIELKIQLTKNYTFMPYMDSLRYYDPIENIITTKYSSNLKCLSYTDGTYGDLVSYSCGNCGAMESGFHGSQPYE